FSINQDRATTCAIEPQAGGDLYEVRDDGQRCPWGKVLVWEPPHRLVHTWHPGHGAEEATEVEVRFSAQDGSTLVELEHRGWEARGEKALTARDAYDSGWEPVLARYAEAASA
ncbi:MAG: SRPBCC domain-containing protein, partial [Gaiellaceae bacterium]